MMKIPGWKYYNHAAIPTTPPHINPDTSCVNDGTIWKIDGSPLLARWTTDFDCDYETNWWYLIKDTKFDFEDISSKNQKSIRQALKKCDVQKIVFSENMDQIYSCYLSAYAKYENADNMMEKEQFINFCNSQEDYIEYWGGYDKESGCLIGYLMVGVFDNYVELKIAKFNPEHSNKRVSDALYFTVLDYYLNSCSKKYVSSGARNINHKTNTQEYKIKRFGFRKAFCKLHVEYNPKVKILMRIAYPFRKVFKKLDHITFLHQVNSIFLMDEISRQK